jgi:hypothetical protein
LGQRERIRRGAAVAEADLALGDRDAVEVYFTNTARVVYSSPCALTRIQ